MKIAVASGKGGTGKTTVSLALAEAVGSHCCLADCDVEEPNCRLFSAAEIRQEIPVAVPLPEFAATSCSGCGKCTEFCRFHALARLGKRILVFPELCHSCGGCLELCPEGALREKSHIIGRIEVAADPRFTLASGIMTVGHSMAPPLIRRLKEFTSTYPDTVFDAPPGTACSMVSTIRGCDHIILVTEPTPFGLHDLQLAYHTAAALQIPCSVILNRAGGNDGIIRDFCRRNDVPLAMEIPFSDAIAAGYSRGRSLLESAPELRGGFSALVSKLRREATV